MLNIQTFSGHSVEGPIDINGYWNDRKGHDLYRLMVSMSHALFPTANSAIDVGCYTSGLLVEMDWIEHRVASDLQKRLSHNWANVSGVEFIAGDAFHIDFADKFDLVISNQVIEHLADPQGFAEKLLGLGRGLIISTTYETPAGLIPGHIQDPISMEKFRSWFPVEIDAWTICFHPTAKKIGHIIAVIRDQHPNRY